MSHHADFIDHLSCIYVYSFEIVSKNRIGLEKRTACQVREFKLDATQSSNACSLVSYLL